VLAGKGETVSGMLGGRVETGTGLGCFIDLMLNVEVKLMIPLGGAGESDAALLGAVCVTLFEMPTFAGVAT